MQFLSPGPRCRGKHLVSAFRVHQSPTVPRRPPWKCSRKHSSSSNIGELEGVLKEHAHAVSNWMAALRTTHHFERDRVDLSRVTQLFYTLPSRSSLGSPISLPIADQPLPLGHHLILFPPLVPEALLNSDGTDPTYNAPFPFSRRMWAGGRFEFASDHVLRVGEDVTCETAVPKVELKTSGAEPMVFVNQLRQFRNGKGELAITETRTHVFLQPPAGGVHATRATDNKTPLPNAEVAAFTFTCVPTPVTLFRFSALTFNSHMIHLDPEFSRNVDGHPGSRRFLSTVCLRQPPLTPPAYLSPFPDRLVHGPLTALLLLELASSNLPNGRRIASFSYRAKHPVIVNQPLLLGGVWSDKRMEGKLWAASEAGLVCMVADVHLQ